MKKLAYYKGCPASLSAKELAAKSGFGTPARMNRAFTRELGIPPRTYGALHKA